MQYHLLNSPKELSNDYLPEYSDAKNVFDLLNL